MISCQLLATLSRPSAHLDALRTGSLDSCLHLLQSKYWIALARSRWRCLSRHGPSAIVCVRAVSADGGSSRQVATAPLTRVQLHPICTSSNLPSDRLADLFHTVGHLGSNDLAVLNALNVVPNRAGVLAGATPGGPGIARNPPSLRLWTIRSSRYNGLTRDIHSRRERYRQRWRERALQVEVCVLSPLRAEITNGRVASLDGSPSMGYCSDGPLNQGLVQDLCLPGSLGVRVEEQMDMGVDQTREDGQVAQVDLGREG